MTRYDEHHEDEQIVRPHPRTIGWLGTTALAMGGCNQSLFLIGALIATQGTAAVPLLAAGLMLSWAAAFGWTELILMWPNRVGGIAATCAEAFRPYSPVLANLTGVCYWWGWVPTCGLTALLSASAIHEWYLPAVSVPVLATGLVLLFTVVNLCGVRWTTRLAIPIATASAALAFLSASIPILSGHVDWRRATTFHLMTPFGGPFGHITGAMAGLYLIGFAAPAFEAAACHVGETVNPARNVPRAMFASGAMATVYFILLPVVWLGVLGPTPLAGNLQQTLGPTFAPLLGSAGRSAAIWFMMFNMFHGTLQPLAGAARTLMQLAEDDLLPRVLARRTRTDAPWVATLLTAGMAIAFLLTGDPTWVIAAANLTYLIGICLPNVAVWLLRRDAPAMTRPYRAPRGTITLGLIASGAWAVATVLGFEQFGLPTVLAGLALAYSGSALYALRRWDDRRRVGLRVQWRSLHVKLTGAMLLVLALDGAGYLLAINSVGEHQTARITGLQDIFVAVAILTISVGLVLPGMIGHAAGEVARAADHLAKGPLADLSRAMQALEAGDLDAAHARADVEPVVVHTRDELGVMAMTFNMMQDEVAEAAVALDGARDGLRRARGALTDSNLKLAQWGAELERRVEERTLTLQRRSAQLEAVLAAGQQLRLQQTADDLLRPVLAAALGVVGAAAGAAYLRTPDEDVLARAATIPADDPTHPPHLPIPAPGAMVQDLDDGVLLAPLQREGDGVVGLLRLTGVWAEIGQGERDVIAILMTTATIALENAQLLASEHEARDMAEAAVRVRDDFLTAASHDLRTPLTGIIGRADLVQMRLDHGGTLDEEWIGTQITALRRAARRMTATVEEITDVAHLQMGRSLSLRCEPVDVGEVVQNAATTVEAAAPPGSAPVIAGPRPEAIVMGDRVRLERVVQNIIGNAVKYSPDGTPVEVAVDQDDTVVRVTVRDHGVGIPTTELPHIFTQFYRASTSIGVPGTGLGLAGAKTIVQQHGGNITVTSRVGEGTAVVVTLPCADESAQTGETALLSKRA